MDNSKIGQWSSTSLVVGNMVGSGIFLLPAALGAYGGISMLGWIVSALGALALAKVFASLSRLNPKVGGPYVYSKESFGLFIGFLVTWGYWISIWCTNAAITVAMIGYLSVFFPILQTSFITAVVLGLVVVWLLTYINCRGIKEAAWIQLITTILKLTPLLLVGIVGLLFVEMNHFTPFNLSGESNVMAIIKCTTLTLFAFLGIESATIPAESVQDPKSTIPKATWYGTWIAIVVYMIGSFSVMGILAPTDLVDSSAPFADAAAVMWGPGASYLVALGAVISTFGALNGWILMQGQVPYAAAKDNLFPKAFGKTNRAGMPYGSLVITSILISILMMMNYTRGLNKAFEFMILLSTLCVLVPYFFSAGAYMMKVHEGRLKPQTLGYGVFAFIFSIFAVIGSGAEVVFYGFIMLMCGIPVYVWLKKENKEEQ